MTSREVSYPWLAYHHGHKYGDRQYKHFCKISSLSSGQGFPVLTTSKNIPPELQTKIVLYSSPDGNWLLLCEFVHDHLRPELCIWSPATQNSIHQLPSLREDLHGSAIEQGFLSTCPTNPNCLILLLIVNAPLILYCRVGDQNWCEFNYAEAIRAQTGRPEDYLEHPVTFDGKIYATTWNNLDLVQIKFDREDDDNNNNNCCSVQVLAVGQDHYMSTGIIRTFLVPLNHRLYLVVLSARPFGFEYQAAPGIGVYTFDFLGTCWKSVTSLKGGSLFLCNSYSLSCQPQPRRRRGGRRPWSYIYFTSPSYSSYAMFVYRVEDDRITSYLRFPTKFRLPWDSNWIIFPSSFPSACDIHEQKKSIIANHQQQQQQCCNLKSMLVDSFQWKSGRVQSTTLCDLPREILGVIAGNISSFIDYIDFRCVNKFCASSTVGMRSKRTYPFSPCLIYRDKVKKHTYNLIDSNLNRKLCFKIPEALNDYRICCSKDGWLLLVERRKRFTLFNPFTMQILPETETGIEVDDAVWGDGNSNLTFLGNPAHSSSDFFVFAMSVRFEEQGTALLSSGTRWKTFIFGSNHPQSFKPSVNSPVVIGDWGYYLGDDGKLAAVNVRTGSSGIRVNIPVSPCPHFARNYLAICGGAGVLSIFMGETGRGKSRRSWVRVFKLKYGKWEWEEMFSLGRHSLYLSWPSSVCVPVRERDMANRIYFPRIYKGGLVYYSLSTKSFHSLGNDDELQHFYGTRMYLDCAWIQPSWS